MHKHTATRRFRAILIAGLVILVTSLCFGCGDDKQAEEAQLDYDRGCESFDQGDYKLAISYFEKVEQPRDLYQQAQSKIALAEDKLLEKELDDSAINYEKGLERFNNGQHQLALDSFKRVSDKDTERYNKAQEYIGRCNEKIRYEKERATVVETPKPATKPTPSSKPSFETLAELSLGDGYTWVRLNSTQKTELIAFMKDVMATTSTPMKHSVNWYVEMLDAFYQGDHYIMSQPIIDTIDAGELLYDLY